MAAAKFIRADAQVTPEETRKVRRILEAQFAGDAADRTCGIDEPAPCFQYQPLLDHVEGGEPCELAAESIQAGFRHSEAARIALDRPMFEVLGFDQLAKGAQPL